MTKQWGRGEYWGIGSEYDPDWFLSEEQKELRQKLINACKTKIRPHAIHCDQTYEFPRKSLDVLAELGLLGVCIPKELGGLGENHVCITMVIETLARYGCPSTALVYCMHLSALSLLLLRYHNNSHIKDLLTRINTEKLLGTFASSDPTTGGHPFNMTSSKVRYVDEKNVQLLKYGAWVTSSGYADWYLVHSLSPDFDGDYSNLSTFLVYKNEIRASTKDWSALGMHGNQSGPLRVDGVFDRERIVGAVGEGFKIINESFAAIFFTATSACWNGIALACLDVAKKHVTHKAHADVGMRICDYPTIQDYFGESMCNTNASRMSSFALAQALDAFTNGCDFTCHSDPTFMPRTRFSQWLWQVKYTSSKNVSVVSDRMLQACGGSGYKTDLGLERLLRDGKAGWLMTISNEMIQQIVGKTCLMGFDVLDLWYQNCDERVLHHELNKMKVLEKKSLALQLLAEAEADEQGRDYKIPYQDTDFDNPFNTAPPTYVSKVRARVDGRNQERYLSPVSRPHDFGIVEVVLRFETHGLLSQHFKTLKPGDQVEFQGPCGGFEYEAFKLDKLIILASGGGITPGLQLIRCIMDNPEDKSKVVLIYFSENSDEILYRSELDNYANAACGRFRVIYTLGEAPENWNGEEGYIDTPMISKYVSKPNGLADKVLLCGGPSMIFSSLFSLRSLGFPSESVYVYGQLGVEQVKSVFGRNVKLSGHRCDSTLRNSSSLITGPE